MKYTIFTFHIQKHQSDNKYVQKGTITNYNFFLSKTSTAVLTSLPDKNAFSLGEDTATWHATSFNAAASEDVFGLVGLTPSFLLQPTAPQ